MFVNGYPAACSADDQAFPLVVPQTIRRYCRYDSDGYCIMHHRPISECSKQFAGYVEIIIVGVRVVCPVCGCEQPDRVIAITGRPGG